MFNHCFHWIFRIGFVCAKHHCPLVRWVRLALMRNRVARWVGLPTGDGPIRRVRLAKRPAQYRGLFGQTAQRRVVHVQTLFSL
jgi:hypothetical protein